MKVAYAVCLLAAIFVHGCIANDPASEPAADEVSDFVAWVGKDGLDVKQCDTTPESFNAKQECEEASKNALFNKNTPGADENAKQAAWQPMCDALLNYTCEAGTDALTNALSTAVAACDSCEYPTDTSQKRRRQSDTTTTVERSACCAGNITDDTPPPTSPSTSSPSEESGDNTSTTTPGPTEDTTTMEPSTTQGGSDSDSAINIGASGLLVTLITMMAAGVNIA